MSQIFRPVKAIQVLRNADFYILEMFLRVFDELSAPSSFVLAGAYLSLIFISGGRKNKKKRFLKGRKLSLQTNIVFPRGAFYQLVDKQERVHLISDSSGDFMLCEPFHITIFLCCHIILTPKTFL